MDKRDASEIRRIYIHHSAGPQTASIEAIRRFHVENRGFADIGYHALVRLRENGLWWAYKGRPLDRVGAHVAGDNRRSLGLCLLGQYDPGSPGYTGPPPEEAIQLISVIAGAWCREYKIDPFGGILGHRDHQSSKTVCPGSDLWAILPEIRRRAARVPGTEVVWLSA